MFSFLISLAALVIGYILYGKFVERRFGADPTRKTPAITKADGVDYIPMPAWKVYMIQFLNIAGTGPIFGAIMGAKFGPSAYLWIVLGCIFAGAVHDYMTGMLPIRNGGVQPCVDSRRHRGGWRPHIDYDMGRGDIPLLSSCHADADRQDHRTDISGFRFRADFYGLGSDGLPVCQMAFASGALGRAWQSR